MRDELKKLIKKQYNLTLFNRKILYPQLSYYECLEVEVATNFQGVELVEWIYNFLNSYIIEGEKITTEEFNSIDIKETWNLLQSTTFKGYFGNEKSKLELAALKKEQETKTFYTPFSAYIMSLCEKFNLDPLELLQKYTPEQLSEYTEGIVYLSNEASEEGRRKNRVKYNLISKEGTTGIDKLKEEAERIEKLFKERASK